MTKLRAQLEAARDAHRLAKYPGDLAGDVLPGQRSNWWRVLFASGAAGAIAAGVALFIFLRNAPVTTPSPQEPPMISLTVPPRPVMPEGVPIVPPAHDFSAAPAKPEITTARPDEEPSRPQFPSRFAEL